MASRVTSPSWILWFVTSVILGTAAVVVGVHAVAGSWATGAMAGVIAGTITAVTYPMLIRRRT